MHFMAAESSEFRMLSSDGVQIYPLANSDFLGYRLPTRRIRTHENIYSQSGVRPGPSASGEYTNRSINPQLTPPAFLESTRTNRISFGSTIPSNPRETSGFLGARTNRFSTSMRTVAGLESSATGYQRRELAYGMLEASNYTLIHLAGPAAEGHDAKRVPTQKAVYRQHIMQSPLLSNLANIAHWKN